MLRSDCSDRIFLLLRWLFHTKNPNKAASNIATGTATPMAILAASLMPVLTGDTLEDVPGLVWAAPSA